MSFTEWSNKKKKQEEEEQSSKSSSSTTNNTGKSSSFSEWSNNKVISRIDSDYINSFISDSNDFLKTAEEEYKSLGWSSSFSSYIDRSKSFEDLDTRAYHIGNWLEANKNNINKETYDELSNTLSSLKTSTSSVLGSFKNAMDYYSQWDSEADYNTYKKISDINNMSLEELKAKVDEYENIPRGLKPIDSDKPTNGIAYTTPDGKNVTWKSLYESKVKEEAVTSYKSSALSDPEFEKYVQIGVDDASTINKWGLLSGGDNRVAGFRGTAGNVLSAQGIVSGKSAYQDEINLARAMTEEEANIYNYYYGKYGKEKADEYYNSLESTLKKRYEEGVVQNFTEFADEHMVLGSALSVATNILSGAEYITEIFDSIASGEIDTNLYAQATQGIRNTVSEKVTWDIAGWDAFDFVYSTGMSWADSMTSMAMFGSGGGVALGLTAAAQGTNDALNRGMTGSQAFFNGFMSGVFEGIFETVSIGNFQALKEVSATTFKGVAKNIAKSMLVNASEETFTELANVAYDTFLNGDFSQYETSVRQYMNSGLSESEAKFKTALDIAGQVVEAGASGALMGFGSGVIAHGTGVVSNQIDNAKAYKSEDSVQALIESGLESPEGSKSRTLAEKAQQKVAEGKSLSTSEVARLVNANKSQISSEGIADDIQSGLDKTYSETNATEQELFRLAQEASGITEESSTPSKVPYAVFSNEARERLKNNPTPSVVESLTGSKSKASVGNYTAQKENAVQSKFKASEEGKTKVISTGEEVSIKEVSSVKDGTVMLRLGNGNVVNANDIEFASSEEGLLYENVVDMNLNSATANAFIDGYKLSEGMSVQEYALGFREAYRYGEYGFSATEMSRKGFSERLPQALKDLAYGLGKIDAKYRTTEKQKAVAKSAITTKVDEGTMSVDEALSQEGLTERQKESLKGVKVISDNLGINIRFFVSAVGENGKRIGENGRYDPETGTVYIDLYAGMSGEGTILFTAAHELTHHIRQWSPAKFKIFADFLLEQYGQKGISVNALVRRQMEKAKRNGRTISYDTAYEEVIADSCETFLADGDAINKIAELKKKDKSLWQTIKDFLIDLVAKIRKAYEGLKPDSAEGRYVAEMLDVAERLKALWTEALIDAGETYSEVRNALGKDSTLEVNDNGEFTLGQTKDGKILLNDRTYDEGGRETLITTLKAEGYSNEDIEAALTIIDAKHELVKRLGKEFSEQGKINEATLTTDVKNGHAVLSALVSNGDYPVNIDLLMVCKKRQAYQRVINRLCESGLIRQATLDALAIAEINKILGKYGFETACLGCFVESRRLRIQEWADTICKEWNGLVDKMVGKGNAESFNFASETFVSDLSDTEVQALSNDLESAYERDALHYGKTTVVKKMEQLLREVPSLRKHLSVADLITPTGRTHLKSLSAELNSLVACRYGSNTPKIVQDFNPYNHELAMYGTVPKAYSSLREYLYAIGGARMQSFSDFIVENWFDYCQIVADLAARKLPMHTYTKEIALAKLFGMTGIKINMSLIPDIDRSLPKEYAGLTKNANGEYELIFADKDRFKATGGKTYMQSINFADAVALQNDPRYSSNVGTIAVGISDNHIRMMLDDPRIRMIIPYHSSGMNPIFANLVGTDYYKDYTNDQTASVAYLIDSKGKKRTDISLTKDQKGKLTAYQFNVTLQELGDARKAADAYLEWCADASQHTITINGETYTAVLNPEFKDFADHPNYYKLMEDFNPYDCITEKAAPQGDVQQIYPDDFEDILRAELTSRDNYRKKQEPKWDSAMGEIEAYLKKHKKADTIAYAKEHGIKLSKKDMKLSDRDSNAPTFYSYMGKVIDGIKLEKMGAGGVVSYLKGKGVKDEEIKWSGIEAFLEGKKSVTKAELQEFVAGSQLQIVEQMSGTATFVADDGNTYKDEASFKDAAYAIADKNGIDRSRVKFIIDTEYDMDAYAYVGTPSNSILTAEVTEAEGTSPRWSQYKLDGGSNYRELVFQMPNSTYNNRAMRAHWGQDAEGVLAHARIQDMTTSDGKRMLFVEELQSDWHNEGHAKGYTTKEYEDAVAVYDRLAEDYENKRKAFNRYVRSGEFRSDPDAVSKKKFDWLRRKMDEAEKRMQDAERDINALKEKGAGDVPDAPFRTTYHEYVLKRLIRMAAEEGYDSIGWTPADIQSDRWSDEFAEGYRIEYDQDIPKFLRKYGKKWGATVGKTMLDQGWETYDKEAINIQRDYLAYWQNELSQAGADEELARMTRVQIRNTEATIRSMQATGTEVWSMDITDSMKDSVLSEGQVLYSDRVTDKETLDFLNDQLKRGDVVEVYRAMQVIDGKLYPPMNAYTYDSNGKKVLMPHSELNVWEQSVERPDLIDPKTGKFKLDKGKVDSGKRGTPIPAAYNPYIHTSLSMLNDQFTSAYTRSNLVTVKGIVPKSELTSGYHAQYAKDSVGETEWHSGVVSTQLPESRKVILSRWFMPIEILDNDVVAENIKKMISGTNIEIPFNVVSPKLRKSLENIGVPVSEGRGLANLPKKDEVKYSDRDPDSVSNRTLLANALETVAQNDIERNKLKQYKEKISLIEAEQARHSEIMSQLFSKDVVLDAKTRKDLQFEMKQISNRINTYDRQLLTLEATSALKKVLEREKEMARKKQAKKDKDALEAYRERAAKTQRELMTRYQESRKKATEGRHKTEMRHKIKDVVSELNQYLLRGTKEKHVPIELQGAVAEALYAVNMDTVGSDERIAKLMEDLRKAKTPEAIDQISKRIERVREMGDRMDTKLKALREAYDKIVNSDDPLIANSHDEVISSTIDKVIEYIGSTPLRDMSLHQLEAVYDMYKMILTTVRNANKAFKAKKSEEISVIANRVMEEIDKQGKKSEYRTKGQQTRDVFNWNNLKPVYAFERIGSHTFADVFSSVRAGEDVWATDVTEAKEFRIAQYKKHGYDSWDFSKRFEFTSTSGMNFKLSLDQIMSLYAYSKREQAAEHLKRGGIVFDETTEITIKNKLGIPVKFNPTQATAYNISDETLGEIISKLTPEQMAFVDEMQDYLSTTMGEKGNEVSLALYGIKLFKEKFYFPLKSATQFMAKAKEQQTGEVKIKNSGFSKETAPKANNPIVLTPFMNVWANHVNEMSMYHAFVLPMEDFYRVYNYKTPTSDTMATESVEMFLQNAHGKAVTKYLDQLLKDLNGGAISDPRESAGKVLMSKFKKAQVLASLSVVVQQPTAIVRAMALVDAKHFGIAPISRGVVRTINAKKHKALWGEVKKYAPVAIIKEMGYFDTNMGLSAKDFLTAKEYEGIKDKAKAVFTDGNFRDDMLAKLPALADELAWVSIWEAVKRETLAKNKSLSPKSEEFLKAVGERFTEVITKTQVYDSVLARSGNMRSKSAFMNMVTSFMAEPTTSINMLQDALRKFKTDKKYTAKTIGAVFGSVVLNAALVSLVYAMRDDDEDETFTEKYLSRLVIETLDGINPLTYIPIIKDVWSIMQGFDVERADMSLISDLWGACEKVITVLGKDTENMDDEELSEYAKEVSDALWGVADHIASLVGLPVKNIRRDINGVVNLFETLGRDMQTTSGSLMNEILEEIKSSTPIANRLPGETKADKLYDAIVSGDTAYVNRLKSGYETESAYNSAIRKALRENDPRIKEAAKARYNGDTAEYMRIAKEIIAEKHFSQDNVVAAINAELNAMKKGESTSSSSTSKVESIFEMSDYYGALVGRDEATAYTVKEDIIKADIANGKDRDEAESNFYSKFTSHIREQYEEGEISDYEAQNMLVQYGNKSEEEAYSKVQYWDFKKRYPDYDDLSEEAVTKYYNEVEPSGISVGVYYDYSKQRAKCKGTDSNGDGKTDSGSVKAEVLYVINSLPISYEQKDVLYYLNGWSASTIWQAPWH